MNLGRLVFGGPLALGEGLLSTTMYAQPLLSERLEHRPPAASLDPLTEPSREGRQMWGGRKRKLPAALLQREQPHSYEWQGWARERT